MPRIPRRRRRAAEARADPVAPRPIAQPAPRDRQRVRRWPLFVIASPAMVAIWSGWVSLGEMCGFGLVQPFPGIVAWRLNTAITLPVGVEAYGAYAMSAWLSRTTPGNARMFAKWSALGALALGMLGQVAYHLLSAAHRARAPWPVVVAVACLPVITLGFGAALAHLLHAGDTVSDAEDASPPQATDGDKEDEKPAATALPSPPAGLLEQARAIDGEHRLANRGKPISRDNLKLALGIATDKATALVHIIRAEHDPPAAAGPDDQQTARDLPRAA